MTRLLPDAIEDLQRAGMSLSEKGNVPCGMLHRNIVCTSRRPTKHHSRCKRTVAHDLLHLSNRHQEQSNDALNARPRTRLVAPLSLHEPIGKRSHDRAHMQLLTSVTDALAYSLCRAHVLVLGKIEVQNVSVGNVLQV